MDCSDIRGLVQRGESPSGAEVDAHVADCAACEALISATEVTAALGAEAPSNAGIDSLRQSVAEAVRGDRGPAAWLRSRATGTRRLLGVLLVLLVAAAGAMMGIRPDFDTHSGLNTSTGIVLGVLAALALFYAIRPMSAPPSSQRVTVGILVAALVLPVLVAVTPMISDWVMVGGSELPQNSGTCLGIGTLFGLPALLFMWALDRGAHAALFRALLAAGAAGLLANLALHVHCHLTHPTHLLAGHASIVGLFVLAYGATRLLRGAPITGLRR